MNREPCLSNKFVNQLHHFYFILKVRSYQPAESHTDKFIIAVNPLLLHCKYYMYYKYDPNIYAI